MRRTLGLVVALVAVLACNRDPELPELGYHGERVSVGSDTVDQVCGGTLARLDREVEQIETRLDLPIRDSRLAVYIVSGEVFEAHCPIKQGGCAISPGGMASAVVDQHSFERSIAHELVHARLSPIRSVPLFHEGIAEAASLPSCPRPAPDIELADLLAPSTGVDFSSVSGSYYVAGELVAWLLQEFGPGETLDLLRSVSRGSSPSTIRTKYVEHFNRDLEVDALAHYRTQADLDALPPANFGCFVAPVDPSQGPVHLVADLDCDSERVHNRFALDNTGYVEWTLSVAHEQTLELVGEVPSGTSLEVEECGCLARHGEGEHRLPRSLGSREVLQPGTYRLRWTGELDAGLSLDVELVPLNDE